MKCEICGQGPMHGTTIYRSTPVGQNPHWRCEFHMPKDAPDISNETRELIALIEKDGANDH